MDLVCEWDHLHHDKIQTDRGKVKRDTWNFCHPHLASVLYQKRGCVNSESWLSTRARAKRFCPREKQAHNPFPKATDTNRLWSSNLKKGTFKRVKAVIKGN
jgi:hypothetical protein